MSLDGRPVFGDSRQVASVSSALRRRRFPPGWESDRPCDQPRSHLRLDPTAGRDSDLPRKEVIQPHLPVRLPCYDFVPITDPTFDGCLPCGLAHRLRVLPAFMT
jgi:hypothetical protein